MKQTVILKKRTAFLLRPNLKQKKSVYGVPYTDFKHFTDLLFFGYPLISNTVGNSLL